MSSAERKISRHCRQKLMIFPNNSARLEGIHVNLIGPLPPYNGYKCKVTMRDKGNGFLVTTPIATKESAVVLDAIENHFIAKFSVPKSILTDTGRSLC